MNKAKYNALVSTFKNAKQAAEALQGTKDEGTYNFDSCVVFKGRNGLKIEEALREAGVALYQGTWHGKKIFFLGFEEEGSQSRRTAMAQKAFKVIEESGLVETSMYYQMD